jgi:hypothetical protein
MVQVGAEALQAQKSQGEDNLVLVPMRRSDLRCIKAVKFNEAELAKIAKFQEWLATTVNPETGQPFIPRNEFSALVQFCLNLAFRHMAAVAEQMAQAEAES